MNLTMIILFIYLHQNLISKIENLNHLQYLDTINLSNNYVTKIENLGKLIRKT